LLVFPTIVLKRLMKKNKNNSFFTLFQYTGGIETMKSLCLLACLTGLLLLPNTSLTAQPNVPSEQSQPKKGFDKIAPLDPDEVVEDDEDEDYSEPTREPIVKTDPYAKESFSTKNISKSEWERATKDISYIEKKEKEKKNKKEKKANGTTDGDGSSSSADGGREVMGALTGFAIVMKWLFILAAIALIVFLVYRMVTNGNVFAPTSRRLTREGVPITLENIEDNLAEADLDPMITAAIKAGQFSLALRLYYLAVLRELHLKGAIVWQREKTNRVYLRELQAHPMFDRLRQLTRQFERVWYGMSPLDQTTFETLKPDLDNLLRSVRQ
jgi:hypothetical protein